MSEREKVDRYFEKKDPFPKECAKCGKVVTSDERTWRYVKGQKGRGLRPVCKGNNVCQTDTS